MNAKITVNICECYDRLAILEIKRDFVSDLDRKKSILSKIKTLEMEISMAIGADLAAKIYDSEEYKSLFISNKKVFKLIDELKNDKTLGPKINSENYNRYLFKKALQEKFFKESSEEIKLGY